MHLQPPQLFGTRLWQPRQDGATSGVGFDELLRCPQPLCWGVGSYPDEVFLRYSQFHQSGCMGTFWRPYEKDLAATRYQPRQSGGQQAPFTQGRLRLQQFRQGVAWPTTAGQLRIERLEAGCNDCLARLADVRAPPNRLSNTARKLPDFKRLRRRLAGRRSGVDNPLEGGRHW